MRVVVIGAVAAGTSAAAKARRNDEQADIVVYEKGHFISYSGCGMPYYISGEVEKAEALYPRDVSFFKDKYNVDILTEHEVTSLNTTDKTLAVTNLKTGQTFTDGYDKLVIATGAFAVAPPIKGIKQGWVFALRDMGDMVDISAFVQANKPKTAAIIGSGFVGLEMAESLRKLGISLTVIEKLPQVMPVMDSDMVVHIKRRLEEEGIAVYTGATVGEITSQQVLLNDGRKISAELVLVSAGIKPNVSLAKEAGLEIGETGAIKVGRDMRTSNPDIFACGDCAEMFSSLTGKPVWYPLGTTANKTGRVAGDALTGGPLRFRGILGTSIMRLFDLSIAQTGLTQREAREMGYQTVVSHVTKPARTNYMPGGEMTIKAVADKESGQLLGAQIVGTDGVDKRIDVLATALSFRAKVEDLEHLDLAYAPPFSATRDPVHYVGMVLSGALGGGRELITAEELESAQKAGGKINIIDARKPESFARSHVKDAANIPHEKLREACETLDKDALTITYCNSGTTGNAAQNILLGKGFKRVYNLSGGERQYQAVQGEEMQEQ
ncbi:MAG: FAD-dependent oxidoreductase [Eubacteriales bacterium]|nr:FAD-dependent oxidoreductase [Eubacteriales bacterium]